MNSWDTPIDFDNDFQIGEVTVSYQNLSEFSQGGPVVGSLLINGQPIRDYKFGGPSLYQNDYLYVPAYVKRGKFMRGWGFQLAKINTQDHSVTFIGKIKDLIFIDKIEAGRLYYFEDVSKMKYNYYEL